MIYRGLKSHASGLVLVTGGQDDSTTLSSTELYDPTTGSWSVTGALANARHNHTATLLPDGQVLVAGGDDTNGALNSAELYDSTTGIWSATGSLVTARRSHTATLLSGWVKVVGGYGNSGTLSSVERYNQTTRLWEYDGAFIHDREGHTATNNNNGALLVAGGWSTSFPSPLYSISTVPSWKTTSLLTARWQHTATLLADDFVLFAGGRGENAGGAGEYTDLSSAELYDLRTHTSSATGGLATARRQHTATLLPDGRVLVAGGFNESSGTVNSVELYDRGLGFQSGWRPLITEVLDSLRPNQAVALIGSGFKGLSEASGGNTRNSSTNYPFVQLRRIDNESITYLQPDISGWSDTQFVSEPLSSNHFLTGLALITVITNGITSISEVVMISGMELNDGTTRDLAAGWLGKRKYGETHQPPSYSGVYSDVAADEYNADWIQQFYDDMTTQGCDSGNTLYCPRGVIDKTQAVKLILRAKYGSGHTPTTATSAPYDDVSLLHPDVDWINQAKEEGITTSNSQCDI